MMCGLPTVVGLDLAGATHHSIPMIRYFWVFIFSFIMRPWIFFNNRTFYLVSWQVYWDWTWDELAAYDLPATFQYVHDQTGQNLHYVGHSQVNIALCLLSLFFCCSWEINYYRCRILFCIYIYIYVAFDFVSGDFDCFCCIFSRKVIEHVKIGCFAQSNSLS
jgi:hypothetical protein